MQTTTRRFMCGAGLGIGATMLACLSLAMAQQPGQNGPYPLGVSGLPRPNYDQQTRDLLSKYSAANDQAERDQLVKEMTQVAAQDFDARQESRSQELKNLEEQLKKLRALHERRAKEKDDIVRDRVRNLLRDADGLGWGSDRIGAPQSPQGNESDGFNNIPRGKR